jgi:hypothetical protein
MSTSPQLFKPKIIQGYTKRAEYIVLGDTILEDVVSMVWFEWSLRKKPSFTNYRKRRRSRSKSLLSLKLAPQHPQSTGGHFACITNGRKTKRFV